MGVKELTRTAYHEAGHAVIGYRFGLCFGEITIIPDGKRNGLCSFWGGLDEAKPEKAILILFAGDAAQKMYDPDDKSNPSISDYRLVWRISDDFSIKPEQYNQLLQEAKNMVSANLKQIQAVADALMKAKRMESGIYVHIIKCVDNGQDWEKTPEWEVCLQWA